MIYFRRLCARVRLPSFRHARLKLWCLLLAGVIPFLVINALLTFLPLWTAPKNAQIVYSISWYWLLPRVEAVIKPTETDTLHKMSVQELEAKNNPIMWAEECHPPHMIWDANLRHTDRILEQLNYIPKNRRQNTSAVILVSEKVGGEVIPPGNRLFKSSGCLVDNCDVILQMNPSKHVDALVTSMPLDHVSELLLTRKPEDVYIFYQLESPGVHGISESLVGFNWTATYRHDSTIVTPYAKWASDEQREGIDRATEADASTTGKWVNYAAGKSKTAAALISNCVGKRMSVISRLSKYMTVDVFGGCGTICREDCLVTIEREYKFYLAFENSNCVDYITEKFYTNALGHKIVPVVFGAPPSDYFRSAPPNSYIHVDNFPSIKHLAMYLRDLDKNDDLYNAYFDWKDTGSFINTKFWCRLCAMVNDLDKPYLSVPDARAWFVDNACHM